MAEKKKAIAGKPTSKKVVETFKTKTAKNKTADEPLTKANDAKQTSTAMSALSNMLPEKLRRAQEEIEKLARFPEENPNPVYRISKEGVLLYANPAGRRLILEDKTKIGDKIPEKWIGMIKSVYDSGTMQRVEVEFDGRIFLFEQVPVVEGGYVSSYAIDITERKKAENEREVTIGLLGLINAPNDMHELMKLVMVYLKDWSGCDAIGIRLQEGEDFPYFVTSGFSEDFILAENYLCATNEMGKLVRDSKGRPYLECMCGNIISGRFDPSKPFFTEHGSFWTNSTTELLAGTTETDRMARTRNRCNTAGYESVALIPLRPGGETFGLLQFNDKQKARFTPEKISLFERLADSLAIGLAQRRAEEALCISERDLAEAQKIAHVGSWRWEIISDEVYWSDEVYRLFGVELGQDVNYDRYLSIVLPEDRDFVMKEVQDALDGTKPYENEHRIVCNGEIRIHHTKGTVTWDEQGRPIRLFGVVQDITERKQAEEALMESEGHYRMLAETMNDGLGQIDKDGRYVYVNSKMGEILGYSPDEMVGRHWTEFFDEDVQKIINEQLTERKKGAAEPYEIKNTTGDGRQVYLRISPKVFFDADGKFMGSSSILTDTTERKKADKKIYDYQQQLKAFTSQLALIEERAKHKIAAGLHDDIAQGLAMVKLELQSLVRSGPDAKISDSINNVCEEITRMINDVSSLTFELGNPLLDEIGLKAALEKYMTEEIQAKFGIEYELSDEAKVTHLEETVRTVLYRSTRESLINAVKHAQAHNIKVRIYQSAGNIHVCVEDDGVGFEVSEIISLPTKTGRFGLFSIKEQLEYLGGNLQIESGIGHGTKVTMTMPMKLQMPT